jgi:hypothetical protein
MEAKMQLAIATSESTPKGFSKSTSRRLRSAGGAISYTWPTSCEMAASDTLPSAWIKAWGMFILMGFMVFLSCAVETP